MPKYKFFKTYYWCFCITTVYVCLQWNERLFVCRCYTTNHSSGANLLYWLQWISDLSSNPSVNTNVLQHSVLTPKIFPGFNSTSIKKKHLFFSLRKHCSVSWEYAHSFEISFTFLSTCVHGFVSADSIQRKDMHLF